MILRGLAIWSGVGLGHLAVLGSLWSASSVAPEGRADLRLDLTFVESAPPSTSSIHPLPSSTDGVGLSPAPLAPSSPPSIPASLPRARAPHLAPGPSSPIALAGLLDAGSPLPAVRSASTPPRFLARVEPAYPPRARRAGAEGVVTIRLRLSAEGRVLAAEVAAGSGEPLLDEAALAAALASRYEPATQGGRPVVSETTADYRFELR